MALRGSHLVALAILAAVGGWMFTGDVIRGGQADPDTKTIAEREEERTESVFRVRVEQVQPSQRSETLTIRGRTQADAMVSVRAETGGTVLKRAVSKGQIVKEGDLLCEIDPGVRETSLAQAEALLEQTSEDYAANERLAERGFTTKSQLRALKAAMDSAKAAVATAKQDMQRTEVRATTSGQVQAPLAEVGDNLSAGDVCVTLMDTDPMLFSGQVPEQEIAALKLGMTADISLISGEISKGKVRFISPVADANTRTFGIEIEMPNPQNNLRDGMTATAAVTLDPISSYRINPSWLTLADDGRVGVRVVDADNKVAFKPVKIIAQGADGVWVDGLEPGLNVITLGQNFVAAGEPVEAVTAAQMKAIGKAKEASLSETKS